MLRLAAEASHVKSLAGFNLADTYIIVSGLNPKVFQIFTLSSRGGRKFQIPINELYKQIMRTGPADRGGEEKPVCRLAAGSNHCELGAHLRQCQDHFQDLLVCFFIF